MREKTTGRSCFLPGPPGHSAGRSDVVFLIQFMPCGARADIGGTERDLVGAGPRVSLDEQHVLAIGVNHFAKIPGTLGQTRIVPVASRCPIDYLLRDLTICQVFYLTIFLHVSTHKTRRQRSCLVDVQGMFVEGATISNPVLHNKSSRLRCKGSYKCKGFFTG